MIHPEIPAGIYCYAGKHVCPYWGLDKQKPNHENGTCSFLHAADGDDGEDHLLWDQVKLCGINDELEDDEMPTSHTIAICQIEVVAKRPDLNAAKIIEYIRKAHAARATIAVFPEMALPGYMVGDDWEDASFVADCVHYLKEDIHTVALQLNMTVVLGTVTLGSANYEDGRREHFNSAVTLGDHVTVYHKTNLPNYREFDDKRYFRAGTGYGMYEHDNLCLTTSICEDGWDDDYTAKPISQCRSASPKDRLSVHVNLSCSPFTQGKNGARNRRFAQHSTGFGALIYVNSVGIQNNGKDVFVFDGSSTVYLDGHVICALPPLQECMGLVTITPRSVQVAAESPWDIEQKDPALHDVLVYGIRKFCEQGGIKRAVIGLSGGVDSALSTLLHVKALGVENVITVNMPTQFNSDTTKGIAKTIAENLGVRYLEIPIGASVDYFMTRVHAGLYKSGITEKDFWDDTENIQARMRGAGVQAMLAAGFHAVFPNNGNKAELTVGYTTMGGDLMGYFAPLADLWKHEVYETLSAIEATFDHKIIPDALYTLKPSAELSADQSIDAGKGDPLIYWYHDRLFASWVEPWVRDSIEDTLTAYANDTLLERLNVPLDKHAEFKYLFPTAKAFIADLERWWGLFKGMGVVKRVQAPPVLVVSRRAYGFDFREAIGTVYYTRKYQALKANLLAA